MALERAIAWGAPSRSANAASNSAVRGPMVSQPLRSVSATAATSDSSIARSKSGTRSSDVRVPPVVRIAEAPLLEPADDLVDAIRHTQPGFEAQHGGDPSVRPIHGSDETIVSGA